MNGGHLSQVCSKKVFATLVTLLAFGAHSAAAQTRERLTTIAPLSLWVGEWAGTGWSNISGERTEFRLVESVSEKAAGTVLLVEGHGTRTSGAAAGTVSHDGVVMVYRDAAGRLRWNGHEASSGPIDAEITLGEHNFEWSFTADSRGTRIRFIITLDANVWRETGDVGDGASWTRFMEMALHRAAGR